MAIVAPLIDPAKLDTLKGNRVATPRLRKVCYWLEMARGEGADLETVIFQAQAATPHDNANREVRRGKAPTITKGPTAGVQGLIVAMIPHRPESPLIHSPSHCE